MNPTTKTESSDQRLYIAWCCETVRHARPLGRAQKEGCGLWSVKATKHRLGANAHLQANCPACKRRARLNPFTRRVYSYSSREAATAHCRALNENLQGGSQ